MLVIDVYRATRRFPSTERYGLTSQVRRAAVSVAANIAEGAGRRSDPDFRCFLDIAAGSTSGVQYYARLAADLDLMDAATSGSLRRTSVAIRRQLHALGESLA